MDSEGLWRGTSDAYAVLRGRASSTTPGQRLAWLEECLLLAQASGALARDRTRRQRWADTWSTQGRVADELT